MTPGLSISASVSVDPAGSVWKGRPFRPAPSADAAEPPPPFAPVGFSALIARLATPLAIT